MTADHTQTLWVILQTKQKNLLAKISDLKLQGKFKLDELKILYGKSTWGGWKFRTSNSTSKTFSFHNGEIACKKGEFYYSFRQIGFQTYFWISILLSVTTAFTVIKPFDFLQSWGTKKEIVQLHEDIESKRTPIEKKTSTQTIKPKKETPKKLVETNPSSKKIQTSIQSFNPLAHQQFLIGRKNFQFGKFNEAAKILKANLISMNVEDQKAARRMMSDMQYSQCQQFLRQHEKRKAVIYCEKAVETYSNPEAQKFLDEQENKAKNAYLEGYTVQSIDPEQAQEKFMSVLQMARTKSTWRNKASYQVQKYKKSQKTS